MEVGIAELGGLDCREAKHFVRQVGSRLGFSVSFMFLSR